MDILLESGVSKPLTQLRTSDIPTLIRTVTLHNTVIKIKAELDQFSSGLNEAGVLSSIHAHPELFQSLFTHHPEILAAGESN